MKSILPYNPQRLSVEVLPAFCDGPVTLDSYFGRLAQEYQQEKQTLTGSQEGDLEIVLGAELPKDLQINPDALVFV